MSKVFLESVKNTFYKAFVIKPFLILPPPPRFNIISHENEIETLLPAKKCRLAKFC